MSGHAAVSAYGRLTGDPRAIETQTGNPMTVGRLAVSLPCRENGEDGEATAFFGLVAFGELAESLARHLKGDTVGAFGRVKINRYTNRDGEAREELSIMADGLVSARTVRPGGGQKRKPAAAPRTPDPLLFAEPDRPRPEQPEPVPAGPITDDDIPF
jgi:single-strand DNA-binding protein